MPLILCLKMLNFLIMSTKTIQRTVNFYEMLQAFREFGESLNFAGLDENDPADDYKIRFEQLSTETSVMNVYVHDRFHLTIDFQLMKEGGEG